MENMAAILEAVMLVCFGASWPINLVKNYRLRSAKSTSGLFLWLIWTGYVAGVAAKVMALLSPELKNPTWYLLTIYFINLIMLTLNLFVYYRNRKLDRAAQQNGSL